MSDEAAFKWKVISWFSDRLTRRSGGGFNPQRAREALRRNATMPFLSGARVPIALVEDGVVAGVKVRRYRPAGAEPGALAFFHGGGWVTGDVDSHDSPARALARATGREVVSVDYRLAPEHPYPAALDDCLAVTRALAALGPVVVAGDSAGGNLAAAVANRCAQEGVALSAQVLVYPVVDFACDTPSFTRFGKGHLLSADSMRLFWSLYVPDASRRAEPDASPLRAPTLKGVAPAYVLLARCDVLHDEGAAYAGRLQAEGVEVKLDVVGGAVHGFFSLQGLSDGLDAMGRISDWLHPRWDRSG